MNPHQVKTWQEVEAYLLKKGFIPTPEIVLGGRIWRSKSKRHITVPDSVDGHYPDFFWVDLVKRVEQIVP